MHLYNCTSVKDNDERWVEAKIDNVFGTEWVHMAFVYDGSNSMVTIYRNGESVFTKELPGYGKLTPFAHLPESGAFLRMV